MGLNTNINIGPYMIVCGKKIELLDREVITCSNKKCATYKNNQAYTNTQNFCAECGAKVELKKFKEKWISDPNGLITDEPYDREFCDELFYAFSIKSGEDIFTANQRSPFDKTRGEIEEDSDCCIDLTNVNYKEEIAWFEKKYKKIIDVFKKEFGEESVIIKWGIVQSYS